MLSNDRTFRRRFTRGGLPRCDGTVLQQSGSLPHRTVKRHTVGALMVLVASAGFGTLAIFGTVAVEVGLNTTTLLTFRFAVGTALLWLGLGLGVLYAAFSGLFIPAGVAGITFYTFPVYVYALSVTLLDERLSARKIGALVLALAGVVVIQTDEEHSSGSPT